MSKLSLILFCSLVLVGSVFAEVRGDFDGDGKTDLSIYRRDPSDGRLYWWVRGSAGGVFVRQWGTLPGGISDVPALGDYDGDGKTDIAVWRTGLAFPAIQTCFWILRSSDNTAQVVTWGLSSDRLVPQDYDGDGKTDIAVARLQTDGTVWYVLGSQRGYFVEVVRETGDAIRGDYDGDGKADYALTRSDSNNLVYFHIKRSSTGVIDVTQFGGGGTMFADWAVPGDYDGDGRTDIAVWAGANNASGRWTWIRSSDGQIGLVTGLGSNRNQGDYAIPGDYDGDGTTDPAIFRATFGEEKALFRIRGSQNGFYVVQWGLVATDFPPLF